MCAILVTCLAVENLFVTLPDDVTRQNLLAFTSSWMCRRGELEDHVATYPMYQDFRQKHGDLDQDSRMEAFFSEVLAWRDESAHVSGIGATDLPKSTSRVSIYDTIFVIYSLNS